MAAGSMGTWSKWANRFVVAAIAQGAIAVGITAYLLYDASYQTPGAARIVASGGNGGGTWLTVGYLGFLTLGPLAAAVTALFYQHLEVNLRAPYGRFGSVFAWLHLVLMNVGVTGATLIMMNGGWNGGALYYTLANDPSCNTTPLPKTCGPGYINGQVHERVLGGLPPYIAWLSLLAVLGVIAGGIGYIIAWRRARRSA